MNEERKETVHSRGVDKQYTNFNGAKVGLAPGMYSGIGAAPSLSFARGCQTAYFEKLAHLCFLFWLIFYAKFISLLSHKRKVDMYMEGSTLCSTSRVTSVHFQSGVVMSLKKTGQSPRTVPYTAFPEIQEEQVLLFPKCHTLRKSQEQMYQPQSPAAGNVNYHNSLEINFRK